MISYAHSTPTATCSLSLHDALPISPEGRGWLRGTLARCSAASTSCPWSPVDAAEHLASRSEEHTSELQSRFDLVCRLLLEKKKEVINKLGKSDRLIILKKPFDGIEV